MMKKNKNTHILLIGYVIEENLSALKVLKKQEHLLKHTRLRIVRCTNEQEDSDKTR